MTRSRTLRRKDEKDANKLIRNLNHGLLDQTLIICGDEFGRTAYRQGNLSGNFGRDHYPRCFTYWLAAASRAASPMATPTIRVQHCRKPGACE